MSSFADASSAPPVADNAAAAEENMYVFFQFLEICLHHFSFSELKSALHEDHDVNMDDLGNVCIKRVFSKCSVFLQDPITQNLVNILLGRETVSLHMQFLIKNNKTDAQILRNIKEVVRNTIGHNATVIANGLMQCGTTCDDFLRFVGFKLRRMDLKTCFFSAVTISNGYRRRRIGTSFQLWPHSDSYTRDTRMSL
jgi:hypothetical protein